MEMKLWGIRRMVTVHNHSIDESKWMDANTLRGYVNDLSLSGDFNIEVSFETKELIEWLGKYVEADPKNAVMVLGLAHSKAIVALHDSKGSDK